MNGQEKQSSTFPPTNNLIAHIPQHTMNKSWVFLWHCKVSLSQNVFSVHNIIGNKMCVPNFSITNTIQYINKGLRYR